MKSVVERAAEVLHQRWRDMHTNEALGFQLMLAQALSDAGLLADREQLAAAWDEGHADGQHNEHEFREGRQIRNPYRAGEAGDPDGSVDTLAGRGDGRAVIERVREVRHRWAKADPDTPNYSLWVELCEALDASNSQREQLAQKIEAEAEVPMSLSRRAGLKRAAAIVRRER